MTRTQNCPAQHPNCRHHKEEGRCDYCGYDFEKEYLIAEDAENARKQAVVIAQQRTKDEEKTQQAQREAALQSEIAAMKKQMAELLAQTGKRNQELESLQAQLAKEAKAREAMQSRLDEEARKRNAERQAELRRQEEEAKARKAAEAKAKEVEALQAQLAKEAKAKQEAERKANDERIRPGRIFRDADWAPEMVVLPRGRFLMGSPASEAEKFGYERPQHEVKIGYPLAMGRYAVTNVEYRRFKPDHDSGSAFNADRQPVVNVSWDDAQAYVKWLNQQLGLVSIDRYRLPSEAEWEYAARAGTTGPFSFSGPITAERVNYDATKTYVDNLPGLYRQKTVKVGSLPANPWGLYEVHGNVWEWVQDSWHDSYHGNPPTDGSAWESGGTKDKRVIRGGSWNSLLMSVRSAHRARSTQGLHTDRRNYVGFRLALTLP